VADELQELKNRLAELSTAVDDMLARQRAEQPAYPPADPPSPAPESPEP
jgi:hypothetical protein